MCIEAVRETSVLQNSTFLLQAAGSKNPERELATYRRRLPPFTAAIQVHVTNPERDQALIYLDTRVLDYLRPLRDLGLDDRSELIGRVADSV
jgi:hypothetical protein